jgi:dTDP-4-dehydrorhamnose 3,5-epimerase
MGAVTLSDIQVTPLRRIPTPGGDVLHALKASDPGFSGFGEVYLSEVRQGVVKAWKRHIRMTLNLVVPSGRVRFVFGTTTDTSEFRQVIIGPDDYARLTVPPGLWFGFQGLTTNSLVLNVADIEHDPSEVERCPVDQLQFRWETP